MLPIYNLIEIIIDKIHSTDYSKIVGYVPQDNQLLPWLTVEENIEVPFAIVEEVPIFPGCEEGNNMQKKNCFSDAIKKHVQRNFDVNVAESLGFEGRQRVNTIFKIYSLMNLIELIFILRPCLFISISRRK